MLAAYVAFAADSGETPEVRAAVADAFGRAGAIRRRLGKVEEAARDFDEGIRRVGALVEEDPGASPLRLRLARLRHDRATTLADRGRLEEAEAEEERALALLRRLDEERPDDPEVPHTLLLSLNALASTREKAGDMARALKARDEAVAAARRALAMRPEAVAPARCWGSPWSAAPPTSPRSAASTRRRPTAARWSRCSAPWSMAGRPPGTAGSAWGRR